MLRIFEISLDEFTEVVRAASSDEDVATFVSARLHPDAIASWRAYVERRKPRGGNREEAIAAYPFLAGREDIGFSLDVLEEDDRTIFAR